MCSVRSVIPPPLLLYILQVFSTNLWIECGFSVTFYKSSKCLSLCLSISASLGLHQRSFFLPWTMTNTRTHNCLVQRTGVYRGLTHKWNSIAHPFFKRLREHHVRGGRKSVRTRNHETENCYTTISSGWDGTVCIMSWQQLWLSAETLHSISPVNTAAWTEDGQTRPYPAPQKNCYCQLMTSGK